MKILFDENVPRPLRPFLPDHDIKTVQQMRWAGIKNGRLLALAEAQSFDVLLTFDQNLQYQQNLEGRAIAVVVISAPDKKIATLIPLIPLLAATLQNIEAGCVYQVSTPVNLPVEDIQPDPENETRE